ncbi:MAG: hypothetical protein AAGH15_20470, partial [Myxococcota bacterium]
MASRLAPVLVLALACVATGEDVGGVASPVVYGTDDRVEVHAHPDALLRRIASEAIAVQVPLARLDFSDPADVGFRGVSTLGDEHDLCPGERFADQPVPGVCSGALLDERHVLTASHCMDVPGDCSTLAWVFGFRYADREVLAPVAR